MEPVNVNTATAEELQQAPGLGEALAKAIIERRTAEGPFTSVQELAEIDGISPGLLVKIGAMLTVGDTVRSTLEVILKPTTANAPGNFGGHSIDAAGSRSDPAGRVPVPFIASAAATAEGRAALSVPARDTLLDSVLIRALAPDGSVLATRTEAGPTLPQQVTLVVDPKPFGTTQPNADPDANLPTRIKGQVIDSAGKHSPANLQVVLWATSLANPQDADFRALIVATTDTNGYFNGPYPTGTFTHAHATVGVDGHEVAVPVHLDEGRYPQSVILVLDLPETGDEDCGCGDGKASAPRSPDAADLARADGTFSSDAGAGRCVDFTKPDRTLEEYTFTHVVRTTEPVLKGLTLDEPRKVPSRIVDQVLQQLPQAESPAVAAAAATDAAIKAAFARIGVSIGDAETAERKTADDPDDATDAAIKAVFARLGVSIGNPGGGFGAGVSSNPGDFARLLSGVQVSAEVLRSVARTPDRLTPTSLSNAIRHSIHGDLIRYLGQEIARPPGRTDLTGTNPIDWDDDPTIYQAATIAHGHLLRFKQEWVADGYSMGNLLYSLPLAPGQKKQLAVVDWERRETTTRNEATEARDSLEASLNRDRDVSEIVSGALSESTRGGSSASNWGVGGGGGLGFISGAVGGLLGVGGGYASADSEAWQNSSRKTSANALQQLRDRTTQAASSVRSQRTSVVHSVAQGERVTATTESVANYNHCHAITIQYFEVLRHLLVRQRLVDVQECLLVPLLMSWFTQDKALRWRNTLASGVPGNLRGGFAALDRIDANYVGSDLPVGRYADETLESVEGELTLRFQLTRPRDKNDDFDDGAWNPLLKLFGFSPADFHGQYLKGQSLKDRIFLEQLGPKIANALVGLLRVEAVRLDDSRVDLRIDPTMLSSFANDRSLSVSLRMSGSLAPVKRADIKAVVISARLSLPGLPFVLDVLPSGSRVIVETGSLRYRTAHLSNSLFSNAYIRNDLTGSDDVRIETPLNRQELRNPREEDKELARNLLDHLNENFERYHHLIWARMSDDRRYMLLDGFVAPNADGRSVASVVDNELIGIVGNCLVMPVARGFHLDPTFKQDAEKPIDLLDHYQPNTPIEPSRIAVPTRGVYAEAVMGACNSCEPIDETRFWRWSQEPIPDSPTAIQPVSTDTRRTEPADVTPTPFGQPIIAMQAAPAAPDPTGLAAAFNLLGQAGAFRDITGLEGTQKNAAAALQQSLQTATTFGTKAADLALQGKMAKDIDKAMKQIETAKGKGLITDEQAQGLTETAIRGMIGAGTTNPKEATTTADVEKLTEKAGEQGAAVSVTRPTGEKVEVDARPTGKGDASGKATIDLSGSTSSADLRAFRPASNDKTLIIELEATTSNESAGSTVRWSVGTAGAVTFDNPTAKRTRVRGVTPGIHEVTVELLDAGTVVAFKKLKVSVPQVVRITKTAAFATALTGFKLPGEENGIVAVMKPTAEHLLARANVRMIWELGGLSETAPAHVPAANIVVASLQNTDPSGDGNLGVTSGPAADTLNETIDLFPGEYPNPDAIDVDTETQALIIQLESSLPGDPDLKPIAIKVLGRLIGETTAHEIGHALLWDDIPGSGHNVPAIANDLMNRGVDRAFKQRTGMENTAQVSPVKPEHYVDHGLGAIGGFQAVNQGLIDKQWPTPPAFG